MDFNVQHQVLLCIAVVRVRVFRRMIKRDSSGESYIEKFSSNICNHLSSFIYFTWQQRRVFCSIYSPITMHVLITRKPINAITLYLTGYKMIDFAAFVGAQECATLSIQVLQRPRDNIDIDTSGSITNNFFNGDTVSFQNFISPRTVS